MATPSTALTVPTDVDFTAALRNAGFIEPESMSMVNRVSLDGASFKFGDEDIKFTNPKTNAPAFRGRLLGLPIEYQGVWLTPEIANAIGRPGDANSYCKSYFTVESQKRKFSQSGASCEHCPISPFVKRADLPPEADGKKCSWRAELEFQLLADDGTIVDDRVWTMDLSTTGIIEFKGTGRDSERGHVSDLNFYQRLVRLGAENTPENPATGIAHALSAARAGALLFEARSLKAESTDGSRRYYVPSFVPYAILDIEELTALPESTQPGDAGGDTLPF